jgi:PIN domain nuclease of toxin-antitoxin system
MRALLDTHTFLWFVEGSDRLSRRARAIIDDPSNSLFWSVASMWEVVVKAGTGQLRVVGGNADALLKYMVQNGIDELDISFRHALAVARLPLYHKDPFDRIMVAQAIVEQLVIISADGQLARYPVDVLW